MALRAHLLASLMVPPPCPPPLPPLQEKALVLAALIVVLDLRPNFTLITTTRSPPSAGEDPGGSDGGA